MTNQKSRGWKWGVVVVGIILALIPDGLPVVDEALVAVVTYLAAKPPKTSDKDED